MRLTVKRMPLPAGVNSQRYAVGATLPGPLAGARPSWPGVPEHRLVEAVIYLNRRVNLLPVLVLGLALLAFQAVDRWLGI